MSAADSLEKREVVTAFLRHDGKILLVKRSDKVGSYQGYWSAISGYLEDSTPLAQAKREIREETGLTSDRIQLISQGRILQVEAPELGCCWVIHPFVFDIEQPQHIRLDWENCDQRWIVPAALSDYKTVPMLQEAWLACQGE